jgi:hypothetical protein
MAIVVRSVIAAPPDHEPRSSVYALTRAACAATEGQPPRREQHERRRATAAGPKPGQRAVRSTPDHPLFAALTCFRSSVVPAVIAERPGVSENEKDAEPAPPVASVSPYRVPAPYGEQAGVDAVASIAAPLLASGAIALIGVVIQQQSALRDPGIVLFLLTVAVLLLVGAVQCGFWARRFAVSPGEMLQWWPDANEARRAALAAEQAFYSTRAARWASVSVLSFNLGIIFLWAALAVALMPPADALQPTWRWLAVVVAGAGLVGEVLAMSLSRPVTRRR